MKYQVGKTYLMVDPEQDSDKALDIKRLLLPRVKVTLVKRHLLVLNQRRRYEVSYNGEHYYTGRLIPIKEAS
jgi:hypothetical protein